jgi:hypothetical protein
MTTIMPTNRPSLIQFSIKVSHDKKAGFQSCDSDAAANEDEEDDDDEEDDGDSCCTGIHPAAIMACTRTCRWRISRAKCTTIDSMAFSGLLLLLLLLVLELLLLRLLELLLLMSLLLQLSLW